MFDSFFFFKQKTAYEMRISDWSSDVCSSDLQGGQRLTPEDIALQRRLAAQQMQQGADFSPIGHWSQGLARVAPGLFGGMRERRADTASEANAEIGRASCRERECQYV